MSSGFIRLTVSGPEKETDLSLPTDDPIAQWISLMTLLVAPSRAPGDDVDPWVLSHPAFGALDSSATLSDLGLLDGSRLVLSRSSDSAETPFVDDAIKAIESKVDRQYAVWRDEVRFRGVGYLVGGAMAAATAWLASLSASIATPIGLALLALVALLGSWLGRARHAAPVGWSAIAALGGIGYYLGAEHLPSALWALVLVGAALGVALNVAVGAIGPLVVGAVAACTALVIGVVAVVIAAGASAVAISAWGLIPMLLLLGYAPSLALGSSGVIALVRGSDEGELAKRNELEKQLGTTRFTADLIVGLVAVLLVPSSLVVALEGVWVQGLLAAYLGVALFVRSRSFTHARHVVPLLGAATVGLLVAAIQFPHWIGLSGVIGELVTVGVGTCAVLVALSAGLTRLSDVAAARVARIYDAIDGPITLGIIPVVFAAQGVYTYFWP